MWNMSRINAKAVLLGLVIAFGLSASDVVAHKKVRRPTRDDLARVWVGGGGDESIEYFRLELDANGTGLLTIQYLPDRPALAHKVIATSLSGYSIALQLQPVDDSQVLEVRGEAIPDLLRLEIRCRAPKWTTRVNLEPYDELLGRIKVVTEKAAEYGRVAR